MRSFKRLYATIGTGPSLRHAGIVASVTLAATFLLLGLSRVLEAKNATVTSWPVSATSVSVDDSGNAWFTGGSRTSISRLVPDTTSTVTTWAIPEGGSTWDGTTVYGTSTQRLYFAERISRPGLSSDAVALLDPATNTFTEWPFGTWSEVLALQPDTAGNIWFGGYFCCWFVIISRMTLADNTVTSWTLPEVEGDSPRGIVLAPDGHVFFTIDDFAGNATRQVARLDPAPGNVTLWLLNFPPISAAGGPTLHMDASGRLYFPGADRVARLDPATNELTEWSMAGVATVSGMALDGQGRPVFGGQVSPSGPLYGVARLDPTTGLPTLWPFTGNTIRGVVVDDSDNMWVNTNSDLDIHRVGP